MTDGGAGAVTADDVRGAQRLDAFGAGDLDLDPVLVLRHADELVAPADFGAQPHGPLVDDGLGARLRNAADTEITALDNAVVDGESTEMAAGYGLQRAEILEKSAPAEFLDRTGGESRGTGLQHRLFQPVEHDDRETREALVPPRA